MRFKDGLMNISDAYVELGRKCAIINEAQRDIAHQLPDVHEKDLEDIKYTGMLKRLRGYSIHRCGKDT